MESLLAATGIRMASKSERLRVPFSNKKLTAIIVQFYQKFSTSITTIGIHEINRKQLCQRPSETVRA
ncbi:hypothetical protein NC652_010658 [Populus alba x Populus x berolinensis]|uniref:Uncharacterized protein n=1 Tax=Populus alba x Populus x berolinensis TaxID=444605 RepID=A0AAD6W5L2_9ROSI|nr:hypothetical protein NC651_010479 [Populus alba x Populus x berolinensis]KAJ6935705.1 hypothetical protein NC652_010658 [Populus alba x Populus x berolinensis]KAJ7000022.1 hypothetical protein NC653_010701 [Populus alba x Populus x berolinensis]